MFLYDKTNILEGSGIFEVDFAPSHGPANVTDGLKMEFHFVPSCSFMFQPMRWIG